jgi:hypothetical protein
VLIILLACAVFLLAERPALAYVDPGTGSMLLQTALAGIIGLGLVLRRLRGSIVSFVKRLVGRDVGSEDV